MSPGTIYFLSAKFMCAKEMWEAFCTEILLFHNETCYNATIYKYAVKELLR